MSKQMYLERELKENPEFFKAFPHLQPPLYKIQNPEIAEQTQGKAVEYQDYRNRDFFDKSDLKPDSSKKDGYF